MEKFVGSVSDEPLRERLIISIDGKGAFRRFKDVLLAYPAERERWFSYRAELLHWHIQQWLEQHDIKATNDPPWGQVAGAAELPAVGPAGRARHRGARRGAAPAGPRSDRDDPGDRAADRDRVPRVPQGTQRRGAREGEARERSDRRSRGHEAKLIDSTRHAARAAGAGSRSGYDHRARAPELVQQGSPLALVGPPDRRAGRRGPRRSRDRAAADRRGVLRARDLE